MKKIIVGIVGVFAALAATACSSGGHPGVLGDRDLHDPRLLAQSVQRSYQGKVAAGYVVRHTNCIQSGSDRGLFTCNFTVVLRGAGDYGGVPVTHVVHVNAAGTRWISEAGG
jgi:hypothetical protein